MSSIGIISASHWNVSSLASVQGTRAVSGESADASITQGTEPHWPSADGGMLGDIAQVLQQMGIQMGEARQGAGGPPPGDGPPLPPPDGVGSTEVGDAMHTLMHDLFQAVKEAQGTDTSSDTSSAGASSSGGYDSFESGLQKVLQQISSGGDSALSERLSKDLTQLASALSAAQTGVTEAEATAANTAAGDSTSTTTTADDSATTISLEDFLLALQQRMAAQAQRQGSGDTFASQGSLFAADA